MRGNIHGDGPLAPFGLRSIGARRNGPSFLEQAFGEHDLDNVRHRFLASPVALQLTGERDPADRYAARLNDALQSGAMSFHGSTADRVNDRIHLVALAQRVERDRKSTRLNSSHPS